MGSASEGQEDDDERAPAAAPRLDHVPRSGPSRLQPVPARPRHFLPPPAGPPGIAPARRLVRPAAGAGREGAAAEQSAEGAVEEGVG